MSSHEYDEKNLQSMLGQARERMEALRKELSAEIIKAESGYEGKAFGAGSDVDLKNKELSAAIGEFLRIDRLLFGENSEYSPSIKDFSD